MTSSEPTLHDVTATELRRDLVDARTRTLDLVEDLDGDQLLGPRLRIINPFLWELGHLAWFQEHWVLRHHGGAAPLRADADSLFDSMRVPHDSRWDLPLPSRAETLDYLERVLERILDRLRADPVEPHLAYFVRLVTQHEDMHDEAFTYTRQTLGYPAPRLRVRGAVAVRDACLGAGTVKGDVEIPGGALLLGAVPGSEPFVFDNEKWAHTVPIQPFAIARAAVTQGEFAAFVQDGGYDRAELWTPQGWKWRRETDARHPVYWRPRSGGGWERRDFDRWVELEEHLVLVHVNWFEADAYARWAGRRLPTEAEWEAAAAVTLRGTGPAAALGEEKRRFPWGDSLGEEECANLEGTRLGPVEAGAFPGGDTPAGCRQLFGNAWEWTSSPFAPYPGFVPDPYRDYSEPWFDGEHRVLRGGAWATRVRLLRNTWRNFYPRDRRDVFAGLRTCAAMALVIGGLLGLGGCATLRQFTALGQVRFSFDRISDVRLAGVSTAGKDAYSDLRFEDVARIAAAVATRDVPLDFIVHVRAENPSSNSVTARLVELDWTFFLDDSRVLDGDLAQGYSFEPGKPADVPVAISCDAYDLVQGSGKELFELALAVAGVGGAGKNVRLDLVPTVETDLGPITYPTPITIRRDVGPTAP